MSFGGLTGKLGSAKLSGFSTARNPALEKPSAEWGSWVDACYLNGELVLTVGGTASYLSAIALREGRVDRVEHKFILDSVQDEVRKKYNIWK